MAGRPLTLSAIDGGINRLRLKGGPNKDALYDLLNGYVTNAGTVKVRPGTLRNVDLSATTGAGLTKGLVAFRGSKHVFSHQEVNVPAGYTLHVLNHPAITTVTGAPSPVPAGSYIGTVQSLLNFDGNLTDAGNAAPVWTANGGAAVSVTQSKFGTGSLQCDSVNKYISTPLVSGGLLDLINGQADFTVEFWFFPVAFDGNSHVLVDYTGAGNTTLFRVYYNNSTATVQCFGGAGWSSSGTNAASSIQAGQWNHMAVCRDSNMLRFFVNGVFLGSINFFTTISPAIPANSKIYVGGSSGNFGFATTIYIDDFRITTGVCLYGGNFLLPSTAATTAATIFPYTAVSLQHFEDGNNSTTFTDAAGMSWTVNGAAKESTAQAKLGSGSGAFLNNADYLSFAVAAASTQDLSTDSCDFTLEFFAFPTSIVGTHYFFSANESIKINSSGSNLIFTNTYGGNSITVNNAFPAANTWYHVALVKYGNSMVAYINGVQSGSANFSLVPATPDTTWNIGSNAGATGAIGYIDEFRLIRGLAAYHGNFAPPTAPYTLPSVNAIPIKEIHFAAPYLGFLYVVAEFQPDSSGLGSVFHYWLQLSGTWAPNTDYRIGDVVQPIVPNGLLYTASRKSAPNPVWAPNVQHAVNDQVEPTTPNGFYFKVTAVQGSNPTSGNTEPTWPTADGATITENSQLANDQTVTIVTSAPQPAANTPSTTVLTRYKNIAGGFKV